MSRVIIIIEHGRNVFCFNRARIPSQLREVVLLELRLFYPTNTPLMLLINLTPHEIEIVDVRNEPIITIEPTAPAARVNVTLQAVGYIGTPNIPVVVGKYDVVENLPEPCHNVMYIVSAVVRMALPHRQDLLSPSKFVRNAMGHIIGCQALEKNPAIES